MNTLTETNLNPNIGKTAIITGELTEWNKDGQELLPGKEVTIRKFQSDYGFGQTDYYLVELDDPVQINPISWFQSFWISAEYLDINTNI